MHCVNSTEVFDLHPHFYRLSYIQLSYIQLSYIQLSRLVPLRTSWWRPELWYFFPVIKSAWYRSFWTSCLRVLLLLDRWCRVFVRALNTITRNILALIWWYLGCWKSCKCSRRNGVALKSQRSFTWYLSCWKALFLIVLSIVAVIAANIQWIFVLLDNRSSCLFVLVFFVCCYYVIVAGQAAHGRPACGEAASSASTGPLQRPRHHGARQGGAGEGRVDLAALFIYDKVRFNIPISIIAGIWCVLYGPTVLFRV